MRVLGAVQTRRRQVASRSLSSLNRTQLNTTNIIHITRSNSQSPENVNNSNSPSSPRDHSGLSMTTHVDSNGNPVPTRRLWMMIAIIGFIAMASLSAIMIASLTPTSNIVHAVNFAVDLRIPHDYTESTKVFNERCEWLKNSHRFKQSSSATYAKKNSNVLSPQSLSVVVISRNDDVNGGIKNAWDR